MFFSVFNSIRDRELGIRCIKRPNIPFPEKQVEEILIPGRDEPLTKIKEIRNNITITVSYDFVDYDNWQETARKVKTWLDEITDDKLYFSDDLEVFYKVKYCTTDINRLKNIGEFSVNFIVSPNVWRIEGTKEINLLNLNGINNDYLICKPTYFIEGEGLITLIINDVEVVINVVQKVIINTSMQQCYKEDRLINLAIKQGDFEDLHLQKGYNSISYELGAGARLDSLSMVPNYRSR